MLENAFCTSRGMLSECQKFTAILCLFSLWCDLQNCRSCQWFSWGWLLWTSLEIKCARLCVIYFYFFCLVVAFFFVNNISRTLSGLNIFTNRRALLYYTHNDIYRVLKSPVAERRQRKPSPCGAKQLWHNVETIESNRFNKSLLHDRSNHFDTLLFMTWTWIVQRKISDCLCVINQYFPVRFAHIFYYYSYFASYIWDEKYMFCGNVNINCS